jgi:hypothetical protein
MPQITHKTAVIPPRIRPGAPFPEPLAGEVPDGDAEELVPVELELPLELLGPVKKKFAARGAPRLV